MKEKREKQIKEQQQKLLDLLQKKTREFVAKNADIAEIKLFGKMNTEGQHLRGMLLLLSYAACSEAQEKIQEHYPYDKVYTQLDEKQKESCGWALKELNSGDCCFSPEGVAVLKQFLKKFEGMESFENG